MECRGFLGIEPLGTDGVQEVQRLHSDDVPWAELPLCIHVTVQNRYCQ